VDLYTADLVVQSKMRDREREFEAHRYLAPEPSPDPASSDWLERARRTLGWLRVMRRGEAS
jgi:hypothetical protein